MWLNTVFRKAGSFISGVFTGTFNKRKFDAIERAARDSQDLLHQLDQLEKAVIANANQLTDLESSIKSAIRDQQSHVLIFVLLSRIQKIQDENRNLSLRMQAVITQQKGCETVIKRIKAGDGNPSLLLPNLNTAVNEEDAVDLQTENNAIDFVHEAVFLDINVHPPLENVANNGNQNVDNEGQMLQLVNYIAVNDDIGNDHNNNVENQLANDDDINGDIEAHFGNDHNDDVDDQAVDGQDDMPPLEDDD